MSPVLIQHFWAAVVVKPGCWSWIRGRTRNGYGVLTTPVSLKKVYAHRLSYELHNQQSPGRKLVCHKCDNPECTNPKHLFLGTHQDNANDAVNKGRMKNPPAGPHRRKLNDKQVMAIRVARVNGVGSAELAALYGVTQTNINMIIARKTWRNL